MITVTAKKKKSGTSKFNTEVYAPIFLSYPQQYWLITLVDN